LALCIPLTVSAEIYKLAIPAKSGTLLYWWPVLPDLPGWIHDEVASRRYESNFLVPRGQTVASAPAVIYAKALYKPRIPEAKSLDQLIAEDKRQFTNESPGILISERTPLADGDHQAFRCLYFAPPSTGSWELVAYGEEDDFYLIFTVSGNSPRALEKAMPDFKSLLGNYKKSLPAHR